MGIMLNRRRVCGGSNFPYDAVEFIGVGANVGPYIDTGYQWTTDNIEVDIEFMGTDAMNMATGLFGSMHPSADTNWFNFWNKYWEEFHVQHFFGRAFAYEWSYLANHKYHLIVTVKSDKTWTIIIDDVSHSGTWNGTVCQNVSTMGLFTICGFSTMSSRTNNVNVYSFKLTDNGTLVRDFIPVVKDNVGYMYDKVTKQLFGNAGTGSFIVGPRVGATRTITQEQQRQMYGE